MEVVDVVSSLRAVTNLLLVQLVCARIMVGVTAVGPRVARRWVWADPRNVSIMVGGSAVSSRCATNPLQEALRYARSMAVGEGMWFYDNS